MTRDETLSLVQGNLADLGFNYFSYTDIANSIQDGYDDVTSYCGQIERSVRVPFQSKLSYYDFSTLIPDFFAVTAIYNYNNKRWLIDNSRQVLDQTRWDWENWIGEPVWFVPIDFKYVALCPKHDIATGEMEVFYRAKADAMSAASTPLIKSDAVKLLEFYGTADLLESVKEYSKADNWLEQFAELRERYKNDVKTLAFSDRIVMIEQNSMRFLP